MKSVIHHNIKQDIRRQATKDWAYSCLVFLATGLIVALVYFYYIPLAYLPILDARYALSL